jgi:hypothetical protein
MENSNTFSSYEDTIENTDGIYTGFSEEIPYERKTEDSYLTEGLAAIPFVSSSKTGKNKKSGKKKNDKKKNDKKKTRKNKLKKQVIPKIFMRQRSIA